MSLEDYSAALSGGHPNSLGRTVEVVEDVLQNKKRLNKLFKCYDSSDEVVRLRTSNAFKRIFRDQPDWFPPLIPKFFEKLPTLSQASAEWTLAQLCEENNKVLTDAQRSEAKSIIKKFLIGTDDWIVLNASMKTLGLWAPEDKALKNWLLPKLRKLATDKRKSVANRASKLLLKLEK